MGAEKFSRYELREELGQGGMATVYRAYDPMFEREVALKILKRESLKDSQVRERFERETKIIARLEHAAIVPVYDVGRDRDQLFFVMRYMAGGSLIERIQQGQLSLAEIAHILQRLAAALDYAHSKGIIHRDLKPGNILFDEYDNAYISDFGIAKFAQAATRLTSSGIIGTPTHMSPEQARGEEVDGRSDIYSLGVILFEMLSGKTPFEATTPLGMAFKHAAEPPPHIRDINPGLPSGVETIMDKVLAKDRDQRYSTGAELADAFISTLAEPLPPDVSLVTPIVYKAETEAGGAVPSPEPAPKTQSPSRSWMVGGAVLLALAALVVWGYPRFFVPATPTAPPATAIPAPSTSTSQPTGEPVPTATPPPTEEPAPTLPPWPVIGGVDRIALTADNDIFVMDVDGKHLRQVTNTNVPKFDLQWVPGENELMYAEGNCVYRINVENARSMPEQLACFSEPRFDGFRLSPDGKQVAISIARRLLVLPFDIQAISNASSAFELQALDNVCLDYTDVAVKGVQWASDGGGLAVLYQSVVGQRLGDTLRVLDVDLERCQEVDPLIRDEFPAKRFLPEGYERYPILPSYDWDGDQRFLFNTFKRNVAYGELYLYDMSTHDLNKINPIDGICCYGAAVFSPDGTHILTVFQDVRRGQESEMQLYYLPLEQIGTGTAFSPIELPLHFFPRLRESIQLALRPALP
jgi:serine/threonine protein kinase